VVSAFSLDTPASKRAIRDKVEQLLDEARYIYKVCSIQSLFQVTIRIPGPAGVGHGAENGDIPRTCHPDTHQQDLVPRQKGQWCDPP